jgi:hypothetical protein
MRFGAATCGGGWRPFGMMSQYFAYVVAVVVIVALELLA